MISKFITDDVYHMHMEINFSVSCTSVIPFTRTDVTVSHCCLLFYDLSLSVQGHLISLKYLQQASGPDHRFIPYALSIHSSHQPSLSPSVVKVKSNWILPSPVFPLGCACLCVCVCLLIHQHINKTCICMSALYQRLYVSL